MILSKTYDPVGRCIYCGSQDEPLSREHIIARGLGGRLVLPKASCARCRDITSKIELSCLRGILGNVRVRLNYPTDHPEKRRGHLPFQAIVGGRITVQYRPINELPAALYLYAFDDARILRGHHDEFNEFIARPWVRLVAADLDRECARGVEGFRERFSPQDFGRMLAKIAHGYAVAELGLDGFDPLLSDLIVGKSVNLPYLVGGIFGDEPAGAGPLEIGLEHERSQNDNRDYLVVKIRLFASLGAPVYRVVAGTPLKETVLDQERT